MHELIERARKYAIEAHRRIDHVRRYSGQPYDVHLAAVAHLVGEVTDDAEMIAAAWLHDVVEDTPATLDDVERAFGADVARLVGELTDVSRPGDGNRALRKAIDRAHLAGASPRAKTVKLADLIDNCEDICRHDPGFGRVFVGEMAALLDVLGAGDARLYARARTVLEESRARLGPQPTSAPSGTTVPLFAAASPLERQRVRRLFADAFSVMDIAEPVVSFDLDSATADVLGVLQQQRATAAALRAAGAIVGYATASDLARARRCKEVLRPFAAGQVIDADETLSEAIYVLTLREHAFVSMLGSVVGVITRSDVQKPIARMWLFGMITLIEVTLTERVRAAFPDGDWRSRVSTGRLQRARELREERARRGQPCGLLDCLQLSDKAQILMQEENALQEFGFRSRKAAGKVIRELESLRNNLAHAQDIITHDWAQIARMTRRLQEIVGSHAH